jgi:hypothetical protein
MRPQRLMACFLPGRFWTGGRDREYDRFTTGILRLSKDVPDGDEAMKELRRVLVKAGF